ncbi:MAG: hypothetical protein ABEJ27_04625 [Halodesulfurarchaeum sp.]
MDRREVLAALSGSLVGLAGCAKREPGDQLTTTPTATDTATPTEQPPPTLGQPPAYPRFVEYDRTRAVVELPPESLTEERPIGVSGTPDASPLRVHVQTRTYPDGAVLGGGLSRPVSPGMERPARVPIELEVDAEPGTYALHVAGIRPDDAGVKGHPEGVANPIAETDRFRITEAGIEPAPHPLIPSSLDRDPFHRRLLEGAFRISVTGPERRWRVFHRVRKSRFVRAVEAERPEPFAPYVKRGRRVGLAPSLASRLYEKATELRAGQTTSAGEERQGRPALDMAVDFVQSLPYVPEPRPGGADQRVKFPTETLVEGGDCEDLSVLLAAILSAQPFDRTCALLHPPNHMGVGIHSEQFGGAYFPYGGHRYFYVETTGQGWEIGQLPEEYFGVDVDVYPV